MSKYMTVVPADRRLQLTDTPQRQKASPIITAENATWTRMSAMDIVMAPGAVSAPHDHLAGQVTPLIYLAQASGRGVATLVGPELEDLVWIRPGEYGSIALVPHMAIYPRLGSAEDCPSMVEAHALEVRNSPDMTSCTTYRPDLWPVAWRRVEALGWLNLVTWPEEAMDVIAAAEQNLASRLNSVAVPAAPDITKRPYGA